MLEEEHIIYQELEEIQATFDFGFTYEFGDLIHCVGLGLKHEVIVWVFNFFESIIKRLELFIGICVVD